MTVDITRDEVDWHAEDGNPFCDRRNMPPQVTKQAPPAVAAPQLKTGLLATAVPARKLVHQSHKVCIYGRNRLGKTTLACQFPKPLLLVALEPTETGGADSVSGANGMEGVTCMRVSYKAVQVINPVTGELMFQPDGKPLLEKVKGTKKLMLLAQELEGLGSNNPYKTVVLDTATSLQDIVLTELMGLSAVPEQLNWGLVSDDQYRERSEKTRECLRPFLDLRCNVVVTAQEKDHNADKDRSKSKLTRTMQQESFMAADLGGATVKWLQDACGYIVQLYQDREILVTRSKVKSSDGREQEVVTEAETGKIVRRLRCLYHPNFSAGFRSPVPDAVPEWIEAVTPLEMYTEMMKVMLGLKSSKGKY